MVVISRQEAKNQGMVAFYTGESCKNGHTDKRYTNTGKCYACLRDQASRDYHRHASRYSDTSKRYRARNKTKVTAKIVEWQKANPDKVKRIRKKYHQSKYQLNSKNPVWKLNRTTSKSIWESLKRAKGGRHWETLVEFTLDELVVHLESQFKPRMSWDNYGTYWELDHIKPLSKCVSFEEAWKLDNLQPLTCTENRSKGNKFKE